MKKRRSLLANGKDEPEREGKSESDREKESVFGRSRIEIGSEIEGFKEEEGGLDGVGEESFKRRHRMRELMDEVERRRSERQN